MSEEPEVVFDCHSVTFAGEPGVGITVTRDDVAWLSWKEAVDLHAWLSRLIKAAKDGE